MGDEEARDGTLPQAGPRDSPSTLMDIPQAGPASFWEEFQGTLGYRHLFKRYWQIRLGGYNLCNWEAEAGRLL